MIVGKDYEFKEEERYFIVGIMKIFLEEETLQYTSIMLMVKTDDGNYFDVVAHKKVIDEVLGADAMITSITELNIEDAKYLHSKGKEYNIELDGDDDDIIDESDFDEVI